MKIRIINYSNTVGGYAIQYQLIDDNDKIVNANGLLPIGHRRAVCWLILKRLRFRYVEILKLEAKLSEEAATLLKWLIYGKGSSKISKSELKKLSKMSIPKMYKHFETRMVLEGL